MPRPYKKQANSVARRDLDLQVFRMRRKGMDNSLIGRELGISIQEAKACSMRVLAEYAALSEDEIQAEKVLEVQRCELGIKTMHTLMGDFLPRARGQVGRHVEMHDGTFKEIFEPDTASAQFVKDAWNTTMTIGKRKAALLGLDAPSQQAIAVKTRNEIHVVYEDQKIGGNADAPIITIMNADDPAAADPNPSQHLLPPVEED